MCVSVYVHVFYIANHFFMNSAFFKENNQRKPVLFVNVHKLQMNKERVFI